MADIGYIQYGQDLDYTPASDIAAGAVVVLADLVAVAPRPILAGKLGAVITRGVVFMPCATGSTGAQGSVISYYATSGIAHATTGVYAGKLAAARAATDTTVKVLLGHGK
jgi:predicted RecA/RadA family phage recombinase